MVPLGLLERKVLWELTDLEGSQEARESVELLE